MITNGRFTLFEKSLMAILFLYTQSCPLLDYEDSLLSNSNPIEETIIEGLGSSQSFAFWSFSIPMWEVKKYPQVEEKLFVDNRNEQLLFLLKSIDDERVIMFMHVSFSEFLVSHKLYIEEEIKSENVFTYYYETFEYEGTWKLTIITVQQQHVIVETDAFIKHTIPDLSQELHNIKFIIGGTGIINNSHQLGIFRGRLSKLIKFTDYSADKFLYITQYCTIPHNVIGKQIVKLIPELKNFEGDIVESIQTVSFSIQKLQNFQNQKKFHCLNNPSILYLNNYIAFGKDKEALDNLLIISQQIKQNQEIR